jgi:hypothetical protein
MYHVRFLTLMMAGLTAALAAQDSPQQPKAAPRVDQFGDPLPEGAIGRIGTVRLRPGHAVGNIAFSPDGKTLAAAAWNYTLQLWDVSTGPRPQSGKEKAKATGFAEAHFVASQASSRFRELRFALRYRRPAKETELEAGGRTGTHAQRTGPLAPIAAHSRAGGLQPGEADGRCLPNRRVRAFNGPAAQIVALLHPLLRGQELGAQRVDGQRF